MIFLQSKCRQVAFVEAVLCATGAAKPFEHKGTPILWKTQRDFLPNVFITKYKLTTVWWWLFRKDVDITFRYDKNADWAKVEGDEKTLERMKMLMPEGLMYLFQTNPSIAIEAVDNLKSVAPEQLKSMAIKNPELVKRIAQHLPEGVMENIGVIEDEEDRDLAKQT